MDSRESPTARWTAWGALAAILIAQAAYSFYWANALPVTAPELAKWNDSESQSLRLLFAPIMPLFTALPAFFIGRRLMHDAWCGTALALSYVLFPPVVATYALATNHAPTATAVAMLAVIAADTPRIGVLLFLSSIGAAYFDNRVPIPELSVGTGVFFADAILPYAMLWVGAVMSTLALRSAAVRQELGRIGIIYAVGGFATFALATFVAPALGIWQSAEMTTALTYVFPLGILGFMPLIVWVRRVMPTVKSIVAWIAFPVIMYSCFWVVLGPVKTDRYPYSFRAPSLEKAP